MRDGDTEVRFRCPHCGAAVEFRGEYRREVAVVCGRCRQDVTATFKKVFFRGVAAEMNAKIVERENREFLRNLKRAWLEHRPPKDPEPPDNR